MDTYPYLCDTCQKAKCGPSCTVCLRAAACGNCRHYGFPCMPCASHHEGAYGPGHDATKKRVLYQCLATCRGHGLHTSEDAFRVWQTMLEWTYNHPECSVAFEEYCPKHRNEDKQVST